MIFVNLIHTILWLSIACMMVLRAIRLGPDTRWVITLAISAVGTVSIGYAMAPFISAWGFEVRLLDLLLGGSLFTMFAGFGPLWEFGAPGIVQRFDSSRKQAGGGRYS